MPRGTVSFDIVRKLGLALPGVKESTAYGSPALKVRGKLLACIPAHRSAEPGSLVVCMDFQHRAELLAEAPDTYYVTDHYIPHQSVLVLLSQINPDALRDLLAMAYKFVTRKLRPPSLNSRLTHRLDKSKSSPNHFSGKPTNQVLTGKCRQIQGNGEQS